MESRKEIAVQKKLSGAYNCTQSVCCTYYDFTGIDETTIKHVGNCFGAGMGNMEGTCGALVGAGMVYGLATKDKVKAMRGDGEVQKAQRCHTVQTTEGCWHRQTHARVRRLRGRRIGVS